MGVTTNLINKPFNPRGNDQSPLAYNRAALYSGKALDFDGVNDKIDVSFAFSGNTTSISFYLNWDSYGTNNVQFICESENGSTFMVHLGGGAGTNGIRFSMSGTTFDSPNAILSGYNHYTIITNNTTASLYVNGKLFNSESVSLGSAVTTNLAIAYRSDGSIAFLNGKLSGFKIFNTALTAAQIAELYNNPEKILPTGVDNTALKLWLPMMEGAGTTAYDGSGNGNHGTIAGATYVNGVGAPVAQTSVIDWNKGVNYQTYSEDLTSADGWIFGEITTLSDQTTAPDGQSTADELTETTTNSNHWMFSTGGILTTTSGLDYTFSVFAKKGDGSASPDILQLSYRSAGHGSSKYANFNLSTGAVTASSGGTASIVAHSNGWYRLIFTAAATVSSAGSGGVIAFTNDNATAARGTSYAGNTNANVFVWGASLTQSSSADSYVRVDLTAQTTPVLLPAGLTTGRDITGVNLFENVRKQGALNLDGNSWAEVHDNESLDFGTGSFTIECWAKLASGANWQTIFSKVSQPNLQIYLDAIDVLSHYNSTSAGGVLDNTAFNKNEWNHFILVEDGSDVLTYVNGVLQSTKTISLQMDNDGIFFIGAHTTSGADAINAQIAQPRIYNRALTAEEVQRNYNAGKNIYS